MSRLGCMRNAGCASNGPVDHFGIDGFITLYTQMVVKEDGAKPEVGVDVGSGIVV